MLAYVDIQWQRFWDEVGRPELTHDPRFDTLSNRSDNIEELYRIAGESLTDKPTAYWVERLAALDIPSAPITKLEELESDPHLTEIDFFRKRNHPTEGNIVLPDNPVRYSRTEPELHHLQPKLGEHSVEILREAGLGDADIEKLIAEGGSIKGPRL
jgi:crotonobetainyl-CoA:carnitine CoA-transferase CaiB-like acyl-CoA transferase